MQLVWLIPSLAMGVYFGLSTGTWQLALMTLMSAAIAFGMRFSKKEDKPFTMQIRARGIFVNGRRVSNSMRFWPKAWRDEYARLFSAMVAGLSQFLEKKKFEPLCFIAGFGCEVSLESDGPHMFVVGPTGSGKSRFLKLVLSSMSGSFELRLADFKGGATLSEFGNCVTDLSSSAERADFWKTLLDLMQERERYLGLHGVSRISETSLDPVLVVVDELAHALREDRLAAETLSAVAARGRSLGVHLICASQSVAGIPRELLVNLSLRVLLGGTDEIDALQLGSKARPAKQPGLGVGQIVGGAEFRFPFSSMPIREQRQPCREP